MSIKLSDYIYQNESEQLICKKDCDVIISLIDYTIGDNLFIDESKNEITVKNLMSYISFDGFSFDLILDYPVLIFAENMEIVKDEYIKIKYEKESAILVPPAEAANLKAQIPYIERLLGGKELFKDPAHILRKLSAIGPFGGIDSVHLEVLISNCLRDKTDLSRPARLGKKWDPTLVNIKEIVFNTSFIQGLEFENIGKAISTGLIQKEGKPSILEELLIGELVK
jgi:hypothetical protein